MVDYIILINDEIQIQESELRIEVEQENIKHPIHSYVDVINSCIIDYYNASLYGSDSEIEKAYNVIHDNNFGNPKQFQFTTRDLLGHTSSYIYVAFEGERLALDRRKVTKIDNKRFSYDYSSLEDSIRHIRYMRRNAHPYYGRR